MIRIGPIVLVTLASSLEIGAFMIWGSPFFAVGADRWVGLLFHTAGCAILYLAWLGSWRQAPKDAKSLFQLLAAFFFPGAGWIFACVLRLLPSLSPEEARVLQEVRQMEVPEMGGATPATATAFIFSRDIQPVADVLSGGDLDLKREAIRRLAMRMTPTSVMLLRQSLMDPHGEIRLYAVNALQRIERRFIETIDEAQSIAEKQPDQLSSHLALGRAFRRFAESGLLEPLLQRMYFQKSLRAFEKGRMLFPERPDAWAASLDAYATLNDAASLDKLLPLALSRFPLEPMLLVIEARFAFARSEFRRAARAVNALREREVLDPVLTSAWPT